MSPAALVSLPSKAFQIGAGGQPGTVSEQQIHLSVRKCRRPQRCHRHAAQQALLLLLLRDGAGDGCFIFRGAGDGVTRKVETQRGGFDCGAQALRALPVIVWANHRQNSRPRKLEIDA